MRTIRILAVISLLAWSAVDKLTFACSNHPPAPDAGSAPGASGSQAGNFAPNTASLGGGSRGGFFVPQNSAPATQFDERVFDGVGRDSNPNWSSAIK